MAEEKVTLSIEEQESIAEAILRIVAGYADFPKTVTQKKILLDDLKDVESVGIFLTSGAVVLKKYISGSFKAQVPFTICYKCTPTTNAAVIAKREVLDGLGKWMEEMEYPSLSDGRKIESINRTTTTVLAGKTEDGASVFQFGGTLKYFKKKRG